MLQRVVHPEQTAHITPSLYASSIMNHSRALPEIGLHNPDTRLVVLSFLPIPPSSNLVFSLHRVAPPCPLQYIRGLYDPPPGLDYNLAVPSQLSQDNPLLSLGLGCC